ncbi:MAG TPA: hypothetical protein VFW11_22870, partial [Cyclobacteriaceae bacterium]|nr:hypothetical protein [Cyclobacteriaceae bacterium]
RQCIILANGFIKPIRFPDVVKPGSRNTNLFYFKFQILLRGRPALLPPNAGRSASKAGSWPNFGGLVWNRGFQ